MCNDTRVAGGGCKARKEAALSESLQDPIILQQRALHPLPPPKLADSTLYPKAASLTSTHSNTYSPNRTGTLYT
eukprot:scaffold10896_cov70-Phaeocystis_antarctica.AAC.2